MVGGLYGGIQSTSAAGHPRLFASVSRFFSKHILMMSLVLAITVLYRVADVIGSPLAGESGFAFAALLPAVTLSRASILRLKVTAPPQEVPAPSLTPELSLS